ncbi:MAG TPA: flagellar motor protein MotB [Flavobacteriaceae bacterium]|nr:flagellar motor protein MotB [Flavobacteriaceae bacterium]MCB9213203.1 flagellar motor protein MotB [Alteromonas sp.]HPF10125.1 flagellar motor protein MotB [Flavobacteriaceae bacterium]HQU22246.1 flagellar motor protein MotB [Flavobacteriaceae bacterium]HQU66127.1 flagellar motor protein MotB [Flavobacteriaceae bacterium]
MKKIVNLTLLVSMATLSSCVSKKKYVALEDQYNETRSALTKTQLEKEEIEAKYAQIEERVANYNAKIKSLSEANTDLENNSLRNYGNVVLSKKDKEQMKEALAKVDPQELAQARTLEDSLNLIISHNLKKNLDETLVAEGEEDDIAIDVDETVVMITISDKLLFTSGSSKVNPKADRLLQRLADVINSEPAMEVLIEGHTDSKTVKPGSYVKDNWDLSVQRSTAVIRKLQNDFNVEPSKLIAAGRSSYEPIAGNDTADGRSKNRRTRIVILPNLDKFLALLSAN